ncbi:MAG: class I SAM-dependent methyltransferase [Gemmatimonadales bacterium]
MSATLEHELSTTGMRPAKGARWLDASRSAATIIFGPADTRNFAIRYWNSGVVEPSRGGRPAFTIILEHPGALRSACLPPTELRLAEAYIYGDLDIEGDLEAAAIVTAEVPGRLVQPGALYHLTRALLALPHSGSVHSGARRSLGGARLSLPHSRRRDAAAIRSHYDVGNEFYELFLDERMVYSCAYFETGTETLDEAQRAKLEHICRKIRLKPGDRLLDIGCGWGGLIRYAAEAHGAIALGITVSPAQANLVRERIAAAGLADRCRVELCDYRELAPESPFDKIVSVGMAEHVGRRNLPEYFRQAFRLLRPGGLFLNHCIAHDRRERHLLARVVAWRTGAFTKKYVFPDGQLASIDRLSRTALRAGLEVRDVESLREHYARTLRDWVARLEAARDRARELVGEETYRVWRLHTGGAAAAFAGGRLTIHQMLLARPDPAGHVPELPLTRQDIYCPVV